MKRSQYNTFAVGLAIGACFPVIGYFLIENIFIILTDSGVIDEVSASSITKRQRSLALFSICSIIIPSQILKNKKWDEALRGMMFPIFFYVAAWLYFFYPTLVGS